MFRLLSIAFLISLMTGLDPAMAQAPTAAALPARPTPPTRDPNTPGYVTAKDLPDGVNAPAKEDGNFIRQEEERCLIGGEEIGGKEVDFGTEHASEIRRRVKSD